MANGRDFWVEFVKQVKAVGDAKPKAAEDGQQAKKGK
jgi:hypothetical protein